MGLAHQQIQACQTTKTPERKRSNGKRREKKIMIIHYAEWIGPLKSTWKSTPFIVLTCYNHNEIQFNAAHTHTHTPHIKKGRRKNEKITYDFALETNKRFNIFFDGFFFSTLFIDRSVCGLGAQLIPIWQAIENWSSFHFRLIRV